MTTLTKAQMHKAPAQYTFKDGEMVKILTAEEKAIVTVEWENLAAETALAVEEVDDDMLFLPVRK